MNKYIFFLFFSFFLSIFQSCTSDEIINSYYEVPTGVWKKENIVSFPFFVQDTSVAYKIIPKIIIHKNYYYSNLFLKYKITDSLGNNIYSEVWEHFLFSITIKE